jgi:hypothetical protein
MLSVHVYGHIDAAFYTLNAIAMVMSSGFLGAVIKFFTIASIAWGVIKASLESTLIQHIKSTYYAYLPWCL